VRGRIGDTYAGLGGLPRTGVSRPSGWCPLAVVDPVAGGPRRVLAVGEDCAAVAACGRS